MKAQTVTIVGMGRVGVSIGQALRAADVGLTIVGHDRARELAEDAKDKWAAVERVEWNLVSAAAAADILVLAVPLAEVENTLMVIGEDVQPHTLVLDVAQLKAQSLRWADKHLANGHYVGVVPVLSATYLNDGRDEPAAATPDLFRNSIFCLLPSAKAAPGAVDTAVNFGRLLGALPYFVDPLEYDSLAQAVETLPGLVAAALFGAVQKSTAWRDILRFANPSFAVATQPLLHGADITTMALNDRAAILRWLDAMLNELTLIRRLIQEGDRDAIDLTLAELLVQRERWMREREANEWVEVAGTPVERTSLSEQVLGGWLTNKLKPGQRNEGR